MPTYLMRHVLGNRAAVDRFASTYQLGDMPTLVGSLPEVLASRVAYKLDLRGPAMTVQSACSTSLLAVAQACQSLLTYQCDAALAGACRSPSRRSAAISGRTAAWDRAMVPAVLSMHRLAARSSARALGWWCSSGWRMLWPTATRSTR
jgi:acetyl-CoA acetyltransferase